MNYSGYSFIYYSILFIYYSILENRHFDYVGTVTEESLAGKFLEAKTGLEKKQTTRIETCRQKTKELND